MLLTTCLPFTLEIIPIKTRLLAILWIVAVWFFLSRVLGVVFPWEQQLRTPKV